MTRILLADDHAIVRSGLRRLLESEDDMEVVGEAGRADEVEAMTRELAPDVALLDLTMPGAKGFSVLETVLGICPETRVLILTMHDEPALARSALAAGAAGYMVKTGADSELVAAIRKIRGGRTYIDVSVDEASVVAPPGADSSDRAPELLSPREREVLIMVAHGHTNREIGEQLGVSIKSVATYRARLSDKLGLRGRAELVRYALDHGLMGSGD